MAETIQQLRLTNSAITTVISTSATSNNTLSIPDTSGNSCNVVLGVRPFFNITTNTTLSVTTHGGSTIFINNDGTSVTLPSVSTSGGFWCDIIIKSAPATGNSSVKTNGADGAVMNVVSTGSQVISVSSYPSTSGTPKSNINFIAGQAKQGDICRIVSCDGTNWYAYVFCALQTGVTLT